MGPFTSQRQLSSTYLLAVWFHFFCLKSVYMPEKSFVKNGHTSGMTQALALYLAQKYQDSHLIFLGGGGGGGGA